MARIELEGTIVCIHHDYTGEGKMEPGLNLRWFGKGENVLGQREKLSYTVMDIRVGRREMRIIRPMTKRFEWQHENHEEVKSGDKVHIVIEKV